MIDWRRCAAWALVAGRRGCWRWRGCSGTVQESLGLGKRSPDEFQVVRRAPLVLPPDYQPAAAGARRSPGRRAQDTAAQARADPDRPAARADRDDPEPGRAGAAVAQTRSRPSPASAQLLVSEDPELINLDESRFLFILDFQRRAMQPSSPT